MSQQFARIPSDAGAVVREVRGLGGVPWGRLFGYLRPHWRIFSIGLLGLLFGSVLGLAFPLVIAGITTAVVAGGDSAGLDRLILVLIGLFVVQAAGSFTQTWVMGVVGERIVAQLRGQLYGRLITLSLDFHSAHRVGELVSRLSSDVTLVRTMLTQTVTSLLSSLIGLVGSVIILFTLSPTLLFVVLLLAPALITVAIVFGRPLQRVSTEVQDTIAASTTTAEEALSGIRVVKSYVREAWELERYDADLRTVVATGSRLALWRAGFGALMGFLGFGAIAGLLWYTGHQVIDGTLGIGTLTSFLLYGVAIGTSLGTLASLYGQFREGTGAIQRVFEIIDTRPTILDAPDARPLGRIAGEIALDHVSFGYRPDRVVLREVTLTVPAGETLALVGPSGSGKTTLVGLIPRLWDVTSGTIRLDGTDIRDVTVESLRAQTGVVAQEATLFGGTVAENIRYGRLDATDEDLAVAARAANAHDFIAALPEGYETIVGDRGSRLSGGQRQRVAIARAILKDPPILLLDEATSSLDNESERLVQEALDRLKVGRTTIIVAHRLSTIRAADRIAVLDDGVLVELGTQDELLTLDGLYARLHRTQFSERETVVD
ncbi:ABC transporter ATP-binding protein [soil metagenome]